jgi:uncharacterized YccA/Bax inhibitor family protein
MDARLPLPEVLVLGRLPRLHLLVLGAVTIAVFVGVGLWLGLASGTPVTLPVGAALGILAGVVAAWVLVHDFHHQAQPARALRRH